jgi:uncharacterized protein YbjT (DUF2867 family)
MPEEGTMEWNGEGLLCEGLPTTPTPEIGKVLVAGATGYVGGRLVPELLARGYAVRALARAASPEHDEMWPDAEVVVADVLDYQSLADSFDGVHTAYYLIHSLLVGSKVDDWEDLRAAVHFRWAAEERGVKRIIYLGELGDTLSAHSGALRSRSEVATELARGSTPVTVLRTSVIIGSGSASYEIVKHLADRALFVPAPPWARKKLRPIAIRDVVKYLVGVLEAPSTAGLSLDMGGKDALSCAMMVRVVAHMLGHARVSVPMPRLSTRLEAYLLSLVTPVPAPITMCLVSELRKSRPGDMTQIRQLVPFDPLSFRQAVLRAMSIEEQDRVHTRWSDAYPPAFSLALRLKDLESVPEYTSVASITSSKSASQLFASACKVGGEAGWFRSSTLWVIRGTLDRLLMGVGTSRGRKATAELRINDVIDFWRVEDLVDGRRLLLRAEMKLPGRAWLEFNIDPEGEQNRLRVTAHFQARGLFGKLYWYLFLPFHWFIFHDMVRQLEGRS